MSSTEEVSTLHKKGNNTWKCTSSTGYDLGDFGWGPYLHVEISCENPEERWIKLHDQLHSFIGRCVRQIVDKINVFIDSQRRYYTKDEEWREASAKTQLTVTARDGQKCTFTVTVTLSSVEIPNEARRGICQRISDDIEKQFMPICYIA
jgi:hypothetical protein